MTVAALALAVLLIAALVLLYIATERSLDWRIIALATVASIATVAVSFYVYDFFFKRSTPQTSYWDLTLGESKGDVKFKKGEPSEIPADDTWVYLDRDRNHRIGFNDGDQIESIIVIPNREYMYVKPILGIDSSTTPEELVKRLGEPDRIVQSEDLLTRTYRYDELHLMVVFEKLRVVELGIYQP